MARRIGVLAVAAVLIAAALVIREIGSLPSSGEMRAQLFARYRPSPEGRWQPLWAISPQLRSAVLAWEDPAFFHHGALSWTMTLAAARADAQAGAYVLGGSSITQQLVKNLYLKKEKTLRRKFREAVLAYRLESFLTKDQILETYLNTADWGDGIVGVEAAARAYFGRSASDLGWPEAALLASLLPNPRRFHPCVSLGSATGRRRAVLHKSLRLQLITAEEFHAANAAPLGVSCGPPGPK